MNGWDIALILAVSVLLMRCLPHREERPHRTPLPLRFKLPAIALVILGIVAIKHHLGGFMTTFPMISTVAAYEARHSLWTMLRRFPRILLLILPMLAAMRLTQDHLGLPAALAIGWAVYLPGLWLLRSRQLWPAGPPPAAPILNLKGTH